jgi:hypothetical protein
MSTAEARLEELYALLDDLCDGSLSAERAARLDGMLRSDPAMRREYRCYLEVHAGLGLIAGHSSHTAPAENRLSAPEVSLLPTRYLGLSLSYAFAVLLLGVGVLAAWTWRASGERGVVSLAENNPPTAGDADPSPIIAKVTKLVATDWHGPMAIGAGVGSNRCVALMKGLVELTYNSGATVTLEGPALFDVDSPDSGRLYRGKATVCTPKAADRPLFCVRSRTAVVTERGNCQFGMEVDRSQASHVYVFRGNVEFQLPVRQSESQILVLESRDWLFSQLGADGAYRIDFMKGRKLPPEIIAQWFKGIAIASEEAKGEKTYRKDGFVPRKES